MQPRIWVDLALERGGLHPGAETASNTGYGQRKGIKRARRQILGRAAATEHDGGSLHRGCPGGSKAVGNRNVLNRPTGHLDRWVEAGHNPVCTRFMEGTAVSARRRTGTAALLR